MAGDNEIQFGSLPEGGWPRWETFVRQNGGLAHVHSESVHAPDGETALLNARDVYLRRVEGVSLWVVPASEVHVWASDSAEEQREAVTAESALWEVFVRHRRGLAHVHAGSIAASGAVDAINKARKIYVTRQEGVNVWVLPAASVYAADPGEAEALFEPFADKDYRYPTFYDIPDEVGYM
jgi:ring-1,2-phenylacetyl-CoA epoxidase subunit PaaB